MIRTIGEATVERIEESVQPSLQPQMLFPNFEPAALERHMAWLAPHHFDAASGRFRTSVHTWLVRTGRHTILIDTCGGNHKHRPYLPRFHQQDRPWLDRLRAAGVAPEQVDFVMCTHLHLDHVGWNTLARDGRWVPTFPNAKYLFHRRELERWDPSHPSYAFAPHNAHVWEDSVAPVIAAGQSVAVEDGHTVDEMLTVEPAPGHTLGHVRIRLSSRGHEAIFSGDLMHVALQVYYPHWYTSFDDDGALGVKSRLDLLDACVEQRALLLPVHFAEPFCCRIERTSGGFGIDWNVGAA